MNIKTKFWKFFLCEDKLKNVIKIKSLFPTLDYWNGKFQGVGWPTLLTDDSLGRATSTYIWDKVRLKLWFSRFIPNRCKIKYKNNSTNTD